MNVGLVTVAPASLGASARGSAALVLGRAHQLVLHAARRRDQQLEQLRGELLRQVDLGAAREIAQRGPRRHGPGCIIGDVVLALVARRLRGRPRSARRASRAICSSISSRRRRNGSSRCSSDRQPHARSDRHEVVVEIEAFVALIRRKLSRAAARPRFASACARARGRRAPCTRSAPNRAAAPCRVDHSDPGSGRSALGRASRAASSRRASRRRARRHARRAPPRIAVADAARGRPPSSSGVAGGEPPSSSSNSCTATTTAGDILARCAARRSQPLRRPPRISGLRDAAHAGLDALRSAARARRSTRPASALPVTACAIAHIGARALRRISSNSSCGSDCITIAPPAPIVVAPGRSTIVRMTMLEIDAAVGEK